jgi:hypothetical protein
VTVDSQLSSGCIPDASFIHDNDLVGHLEGFLRIMFGRPFAVAITDLGMVCGRSPGRGFREGYLAGDTCPDVDGLWQAAARAEQDTASRRSRAR